MIVETLIEFKTAKLAKKKGYDENQPHRFVKCLSSLQGKFKYGDIREDYDVTFPWKNSSTFEYHNQSFYHCSRPTQSALQTWLRIKHDIHISVNYEVPNYSACVGGRDQNGGGNKCIEVDTWMPYDPVLEKALRIALKFIKHD